MIGNHPSAAAGGQTLVVVTAARNSEFVKETKISSMCSESVRGQDSTALHAFLMYRPNCIPEG